MIISLKQRKIKFKPRKKLNHNISVLYEVSGKRELTVACILACIFCSPNEVYVMIPLRIVSFFKFTPIQVYMTRYKRQILQRPSSLPNLVPRAFPLKNGWAVLSPAHPPPPLHKKRCISIFFISLGTTVIRRH